MSTNGISFGYLLPQRGTLFGVTTIPELLDIARAVDNNELFDSLWVGDSLMSKPRPDSLTLLGTVAAVTRRVKLGPSCMATFPLRDPIVLAYQWATLDVISNGRMLMAACTGIVKPDASTREGANWNIIDKDRAPRLEEHIEIIRKLWTGESLSFSGKFHTFKDVSVLPTPVQNPCPIWIASNPYDPRFVERSMQRVARLADGWMTAHIAPKLFASNWAKLSAALEAEGKDPATFPNTTVHNLNINEDRDAAMEETSRFLDEYYGPVLSPAMKEHWTAAGSPQQCIDTLNELARDGAKHFILRPTTWNLREQYERMINEVLPFVEAA
jgi:alkanesulfonate monooxygenase SsuD/methylene tetrahydromethanopterin reductase-like flavin-dependent oxidoreductase (luciferase family)